MCVFCWEVTGIAVVSEKNVGSRRDRRGHREMKREFLVSFAERA